jgi:hypothetical protein
VIPSGNLLFPERPATMPTHDPTEHHPRKFIFAIRISTFDREAMQVLASSHLAEYIQIANAKEQAREERRCGAK